MFRFRYMFLFFCIIISFFMGILVLFSDVFGYSKNLDVSSIGINKTFTSDDLVVINDINDVEIREVVYDGLTFDELVVKLDRNLYNELSGKGYLYASRCLEMGVDPYLAVAISLEETGCKWHCSSLVKYCNNVGGMIGNGCNGFSSWASLDDGIRAFIDNISRNYVAYGLTTADAMNSKYAENPLWSFNVNNYIKIIKNN